MSKVRGHRVGLSAVEITLLATIVLLVGFVIWYTHATSTNSEKTLKTSTTAASSEATSNQDDRSLQAELNSIGNDTSQLNQDLNDVNSSLGDQSSFTAVP